MFADGFQCDAWLYIYIYERIRSKMRLAKMIYIYINIYIYNCEKSFCNSPKMPSHFCEFRKSPFCTIADFSAIGFSYIYIYHIKINTNIYFPNKYKYIIYISNFKKLDIYFL